MNPHNENKTVEYEKWNVYNLIKFIFTKTIFQIEKLKR